MNKIYKKKKQKQIPWMAIQIHQLLILDKLIKKS
jgi:hypothetical protein